jgi:hypothetical protein
VRSRPGKHLRIPRNQSGWKVVRDHGIRPLAGQRQGAADYRAPGSPHGLQDGVISRRINSGNLETWRDRDLHPLAFALGRLRPRVKGWPNVTGLDWAPNGRGLYVGSASPQSRTLLYVDLKGNARVLWQFSAALASIFAVPSPDGRYLAIGNFVYNSNTWMVEGF